MHACTHTHREMKGNLQIDKNGNLQLQVKVKKKNAAIATYAKI